MTLPLAKLSVGKRITTWLVVMAGLCHVSGAQVESCPKSIPELQAAIEKVLREGRTPGAAVAIVSRDKIEWIAGIGKADVAANQSVTPDTLFRLGSVSKGFVALAALQLQEKGKLKLTDTVRQRAPEVAFINPWEASEPLRLVHLMEHTSGFEDMHLREYALDEPKPMALRQALAYGTSSRVCRWPPGTRMAYCNSGPAVVAAAIENVSGQRFEDYVQEHIFRPLRMEGAGYFYTPEVEKRLSKLYRHDGVTPYPYWHFGLRPSAAAHASARDMANYVRFYLQRGSLDGTQVLQAASIERMEKGQTMLSAKLGFSNYGLFNYATPEDAYVFCGHNGAVLGGIAQMAYLPNEGRGYVVMINSANFKAVFQISKLFRQYLTRDLTPPALPPIVAVEPGIAKVYRGYYELISPEAQWFYGFARLLHIQKLTFSAEGLSTSCYGFFRQQWVPISARLYRRQSESLAKLALLPATDDRPVLQLGFGTYKQISALQVWAQLVGIVLVCLLVCSSLLFAPVWGVRKLLGKLRNPGPLSLRVWSLLAATLLVAFDLLLGSGLRGLVSGTYIDDISLGVCTCLTVSIMLSSLAFPVAAAAALFLAYRHRTAPMNRLAYWHSVLVATAVAGVGVYYGYWGLIGLRLWV